MAELQSVYTDFGQRNLAVRRTLLCTGQILSTLSEDAFNDGVLRTTTDGRLQSYRQRARHDDATAQLWLTSQPFLGFQSQTSLSASLDSAQQKAQRTSANHYSPPAELLSASMRGRIRCWVNQEYLETHYLTLHCPRRPTEQTFRSYRRPESDAQPRYRCA